MFQNEGIMMTSLLPSSQRSYEAVSQLLEMRVGLQNSLPVIM